MSQKQNIVDGGSVIGYSPDLRYEKDFNTTTKQAEKSAQQYTQAIQVNYSSTLMQFINASPNYVLKTLLTTSEYLQKLIAKLSKAFPSSNDVYGSIESYLTALACGNDEFAMEFLNKHKNNIEESQIPELVECIYCGKQRMDILSQTIKQIYYGNSSIDIGSTKDMDDALIAKMQLYEQAGTAEKINYYSLAMDTELNRIILTHAAGTRKSLMFTSTVLNKKDDSIASSDNVDFIRDLYNEVNNEINERFWTYKTQQGLDIIQKSLYNYYQKRKAVLDMYTLLNDSQSSILFNVKLEEKQQAVQQALRSVECSLKGHEVYANKFNELEREKHYLKDVYSSFSYNSDE